MTALPAAYAWLDDEGGPRMLVEMLKLYGVKETPGSKNNPTIMAWAKEVGVPYPADSVAWCGLAVSVAAKRATWEYSPKGNPLWARNWATWGQGVETAMLGDVLVFPRGTGGHVALYVGEDSTHYHILGGNQSDQVNIVRKPKSPLLAKRRPVWRRFPPPNLRQVWLKPTGATVSVKED